MASAAYTRTAKYLEAKGWHIANAQRWIQRAFLKIDLFGLADMVAVRHDPGSGTWFINVCDDNGEVAEHIDKYMNGWDHPKKGRMPPNSHLPVILSAGNRFSIFAWGMRNSAGRGSRKVRTLRVTEAYLDKAEVKWKEIVEVDA